MPRAIHLVGPVVALSFSIPFLVLATVTSTLAFTILFFRVAIVYVDVSFAVVRSWFFGEKTLRYTPKVVQIQPESKPSSSIQRMSSAKARSLKAPSTPFYDTFPYHKKTSMPNMNIIGPGGTSRDYEGIGGWRLSDNKEEEASWLAMNSRLELPVADVDVLKRHSRTSSTSRISRNTGSLRHSPVASRNRTPSIDMSGGAAEGYFSLRPIKSGQMSPEEFAAKLRMEGRRASISSSSLSGGSTGGATIKPQVSVAHADQT